MDTLTFTFPTALIPLVVGVLLLLGMMLAWVDDKPDYQMTGFFGFIGAMTFAAGLLYLIVDTIMAVQ